MQNIDLSQVKKVFFIGIGGIGISAIARMMHLEGKDVSGSDMAENELTSELKKLGIKITIGQGFELIPTDVDLVVYTIAISHYDPKLLEQVKNSKISYKSYPEMLGIVTANKYTIAVAGTHGKTTTTAMIAKILIDANLDPSVIVGSLLKEYQSNLIVGKGEFFVVEACEYERSFLNIKPKLLVITNIEADHLDYYKDLDDIKNAFHQLELQSGKVIKDYTEYLKNIPKLKVPGLHNRMNAAAAYAVAKTLNIEDTIIQKSLAEFSGTWRRLEKRGETKNGVIIYDDYAHHPTEIKASLEALRELYPKGSQPSSETSARQGKNIIVLFQPHLFSRTKALFDDFAKSFNLADKTFLLPIYFAREKDDGSVSSEKLMKAVKANGGEGQSFPSFGDAEDYIKSLNLGKNDVLVTMGAGEAYKVTDKVFNFT